MKKLSKDFFKFIPLSIYNKLNYELVITMSEWKMLHLYSKSMDMDDKWFIVIDQNFVYCCRSWTGHCIFQLKYERLKNNILLNDARSINNKKVFNIPLNKHPIILNSLLLSRVQSYK